MQTQPIQKLYKTAFYPTFNCYVKLVHAYTVGDQWNFYVYNSTEEIGHETIQEDGNFIASERELKHFAL